MSSGEKFQILVVLGKLSCCIMMFWHRYVEIFDDDLCMIHEVTALQALTRSDDRTLIRL